MNDPLAAYESLIYFLATNSESGSTLKRVKIFKVEVETPWFFPDLILKTDFTQ